MPKRKLVTTQDKQRQKTTTDFVGRESQLRDFKLNLDLDPTDGNFQMVWNVFGQGGVGKSTLLLQFVRQCVEALTYTAIARHRSAHRRQLWAHLWQCSWSCWAHCSAQ